MVRHGLMVCWWTVQFRLCDCHGGRFSSDCVTVMFVDSSASISGLLVAVAEGHQWGAVSGRGGTRCWMDLVEDCHNSR